MILAPNITPGLVAAVLDLCNCDEDDIAQVVDREIDEAVETITVDHLRRCALAKGQKACGPYTRQDDVAPILRRVLAVLDAVDVIESAEMPF